MRLWFTVQYLLLIIFALSLLSCTTTTSSYHYISHARSLAAVRTIPVYIDRDFDEKDQKVLLAAVDEWNFALNGMIVMTVVSTTFDMDPATIHEAYSASGFIFLKIDSSNPMVHDSPSTLTFAFVDKISGNLLYIIRDRLSSFYLRSVALHEIGHLLGAVHRDHSLMQGYAEHPYPCIDGATVSQVAAHYMIPLELMNYCTSE